MNGSGHTVYRCEISNWAPTTAIPPAEPSGTALGDTSDAAPRAGTVAVIGHWAAF